jgi:hypothetical protein
MSENNVLQSRGRASGNASTPTQLTTRLQDAGIGRPPRKRRMPGAGTIGDAAASASADTIHAVWAMSDR